jgi:acetyl-CoA/propionyl-CoA carboxylase biotin carboxyl carrier protein
MGSKIEAKRIMEAAGVPVVPGFTVAGLDDREVAERGRKMGYPLLVKASAGGGGRGMRLVQDPDALGPALEAARREAKSAFGDDTLLVERYVTAPRHVEIQIMGDTHGTLLHCFERECSIQRRHQNRRGAPSSRLATRRRKMCEAAVAAGGAIGYHNAGTVEFVVDASGSSTS